MRREPLPANPANAQGGAAPTSGCFSAREKRKRIFKACGGLFVRCGEKCEGGGSARFELLLPRCPHRLARAPSRLSLGDGCIPAVPASVSPGFVVPLAPFADPFFARHCTRVGTRG